MSLDGKMEKAVVAASILMDLAARDLDNDRRELFDYERKLVDDSFIVLEQNHPDFKTTYVKILRLTLQTKNHQLFKIFLGKNASRDIFKDESDIIQVSLLAYPDRPRGPWQQPKSELLKTLVTYGASVNSSDHQGKSPLYYACSQGLPEAFKFLVESGADCSALFDPAPSSDIDNPSILNNEKGQGKENLLQVTSNGRLASEWGGPVSYIWQEEKVPRWEPIVMYLLSAGLYCPPDNSSLVKFLHISCYRGKLPYVEKLLDYGVDHTARAGRRDSRDYVFGNALHVAAMMGQKDIAVLLLKHGADPRARYPCKIKLQQENVMMTPVGLALTKPISIRTKDQQKVLEVCEMLINNGADEQDGPILLEACIESDNVEMSKRLLDQGIRIQEIPICSQIEVVQLILDHAYQIDFVKFQKHAVVYGLLDLLRFLVNRAGPLLPSDEDFEWIANKVIRGKHHLDMLRYLICEYGLDINTIFDNHLRHSPSTDTNMLQLACDLNRIDSVELLLELGADVDCPGLPDTILVHVQKQLTLYGNNFGALVPRLIRLLHRYTRNKPQDQLTIDATDTESNTKSQQAKRTFGRFLKYQDSLNLKGTEGVDAVAELRQSVQTTVDRGEIGSLDQDEPQSTATISLGEEYTETELLLKKEVRQLFQYNPLNGLQSIRILELEPSNSMNKPIRGRLIEVNLTEKPRYDALSYARGPKMVCILLEDKIFKVAETLWLALRRLRYEDKPRYLWIDAICLDQENIQERNLQITIMKDIYPMADQVLAWLGEEADASHLIFKHLEEWKEYCKDYEAGRVESRDPVIGESHINPPSYEGKTRDAYVKLCQRPWFLCCWVIQEVTLAKHTTMICGTGRETFQLLVLPGGCGGGKSYHPLHGVNGASHYSNLTQIQRWTAMTRLIDIIQCSRLCKVSDPRDKVYSLLGMFKRQMIPIDYSLSVADVYRMFTQAIIEETQSLNVLYWMGSQRRRDDLCSWVQDFSVYKPVGVLPEAYVQESQSSNTNYPTHLLPGFRFEATKFLVKGKYIEAIKNIGSELKANIANVPGSDNFSQIFYGWELLAAKLIHQKRFKYTATDAFLNTLIANNKHWKDKNGNRSEISSEAGNFTTWYQRYGTDVLAEAEAQYFREVEFIQELSMKNDQKTTDLRKERGVAMFARSMEMACYGRSFFITDQGSMGLAPPMAQPGDEVVWFPGGVYPFIVRRQEDETYKLIGDCFLYAFDVSELFGNNLKEIKEYVLD